MTKAKMSKVLLSFLKPAQKKYALPLDDALISVGVAAWNIALMKGVARVEAEKSLDELLLARVSNEEQSTALRTLVNDLIQRKERQFSHVNNTIVGYRILPNKVSKQFRLQIDSLSFPCKSLS